MDYILSKVLYSANMNKAHYEIQDADSRKTIFT
jgi:hypothetical protein